MSRVVVVCHAMPIVDPTLPPSAWPLSHDGVGAARGLAGSLPAGAFAVSSSEFKAQETLRLAVGDPTHVDTRFGEVRRPAEPFDGEAGARRAAWVAGRLDERHRGWEVAAEVGERFEQGLCAAPPGDVVVGAHGMCLTAWMAHRGLVGSGDDAACFWRSLAFPDVVTVPR